MLHLWIALLQKGTWLLPLLLLLTVTLTMDTARTEPTTEMWGPEGVVTDTEVAPQDTMEEATGRGQPRMIALGGEPTEGTCAFLDCR